MLKLFLNRLSGMLPKTVLLAKTVNILNGNLFQCDINIPQSDPNSLSYSCGSRNLNTPSIGTLPTELGSLLQLQSLELTSNQSSGSIPTEYGKLRKTQYLALSGNRFSDTLSAEL